MLPSSLHFSLFCATARVLRSGAAPERRLLRFVVRALELVGAPGVERRNSPSPARPAPVFRPRPAPINFAPPFCQQRRRQATSKRLPHGSAAPPHVARSRAVHSALCGHPQIPLALMTPMTQQEAEMPDEDTADSDADDA